MDLLSNSPVDSRDLLSRRDTLKVLGNLGISAWVTSTTFANGYVFIDSEQNVNGSYVSKLVVDSEGRKIGLVGGFHPQNKPNGEMDEQVTVFTEKDIHKPMGALFIEGSWPTSTSITGQDMRASLESSIIDNPLWEGAFFKYALDNNVPFINGDIVYGIDGYEKIIDDSHKNLISKTMTSILSGMSTLALVKLDEYSDRINKIFNMRITRREFISPLTWVALATSVTSSSWQVTHAANELGIDPQSEAMQDFQTIYSDLIHPEDYPTVMRNIVWALKIHDLYNKGIVEHDKIVNVKFGQNHKFLGFFLRHPEIGTKYWKMVKYKEITEDLAQYTGGNNDWVNHSRIYNPKNNTTEIIHHESLDILKI